MAGLQPDRSRIGEFGAFLRDARERRGLTLQQVARETRIPWRHLDALEHGDLSVQPNDMYRRAELRAYADAIGLDRNVALARLERALEGSGPHASPSSGRGRPFEGSPLLGAMTILAAVALLGVGLWLQPPIGSKGRDQRIRSESAQRPAARSPDGRSSARTAPAAPHNPSTSSTGTAPAGPAVATAYQTATAATHAAVAPAAREAVITPAAAAGPRTASASPAQETTLVIVTDPPGARVIVDGIGWGTAPVTIRHLSPGPKRVRVIKDGYLSGEQVVHVAAQRATTAAIAMTARK